MEHSLVREHLPLLNKVARGTFDLIIEVNKKTGESKHRLRLELPPEVGDGTVVRLLFDLNWIMFAPAMALGVVFLLSTGIAIVRTEVFSPLLGWASIGVSVPVALLVYISLTFSSYHAGGWTVIGWVGFLGKLAVILWMSLAMARQPRNVNQTSAGAREDR